MDTLEEMNKFLKKYNLPRLSQEETENMNRPITSKSPALDGFMDKFHQTFGDELTPIRLKLF